MKNQERSFNEVRDNNDSSQTFQKNEKLQNEVHFAISRKPFLNNNGSGTYAKVGKFMKIFRYVISMIGVALIFTSCLGGYVVSEPSYVDYARPQRQYDNQIWIDGDWNWNNQTHIYVQKAGYWDKPRHGQSYVAGSWQTTQRGKSWNKGHWQKDVHQKSNGQRVTGNR
jgi:hypothetical protein